MNLKFVTTLLIPGLLAIEAGAATAQQMSCAYLLSNGVNVEASGNDLKIVTPDGASLVVSGKTRSGLAEIIEPQLFSQQPYTQEKLIVVKQGAEITVIGNKEGQLRELSKIDLANFLDKSALSAGKQAKIVDANEKYDIIGYTNESESDSQSHFISFQLIVRTTQALYLLNVYTDYSTGWNRYVPVKDLRLSSLHLGGPIDRVSAPWKLTSEGRFGQVTRTVVTVHTKDGLEHIVTRESTRTVRMGWSPDPAHLIEIQK